MDGMRVGKFEQETSQIELPRKFFKGGDFLMVEIQRKFSKGSLYSHKKIYLTLKVK